MTLKCCQLFFLGVLACAVAAMDDDDVGNANDYIDTVLDNLRKEPEITKYLDPLDVPGISDSQFSLRNIKVRGLSHLYRKGDCSLSHDGETLSLVAEIGVSNVKVTMDYSAKALFFWLHGNAVVRVEHLAVKLDISSTDGNARVNSLKVTNLGTYKVESINGGSFLLNWLLKIIANSIASNARGNIISALENEGKDALDNILRQYKLPIY